MNPTDHFPIRDALITGGAGFIGRNLGRALRDRGVSTRLVDNLAVPPFVPPPDDVEIRDVRDLEPADFEEVDVVVHLAALKSVPESFKSRANLRDNLEIDHHILDVFGRSSARRILMASSCEVYGWKHGASRECDPIDPQSPYAVGKSASEKLASVYRRLHPRKQFGIARFFNVYGPDAGGDAVIPAFIDALNEGRPLVIEGDGSQARDLSHIDDIAEMLVELLFARQLREVTNLGSGHAVTVMSAARRLIEVHGRGDIEFKDPRPNEIAGFIASLAAYERSFGRVARRPFEEAVADVYDRRTSLLLKAGVS